jgi:hypothetical protein
MISAPDMEPQYRQSVRASFTRAPDFARTPAMLGLAAPMVFAALEADFDLVLETASELIVTFDVMLSGAHIRFRVAGPRLADDLIAPFAPATRILSPVGDPDLTIDVWDGAATRVGCSALPFDREMGPYGLVVCAPDDQFVSYQRPASVGWLDRKRRRVIAWFESADALYLDERAKPFAKLISVWLKDHGVVLGCSPAWTLSATTMSAWRSKGRAGSTRGPISPRRCWTSTASPTLPSILSRRTMGMRPSHSPTSPIGSRTGCPMDWRSAPSSCRGSPAGTNTTCGRPARSTRCSPSRPARC